MRHHRSMLLQVWPRLVVENNLQRQQCCLIICDYFGWLQQIQNLRRAGLSNRSPTTEFLSKWNYLENWLINSCLDKARREKETEKTDYPTSWWLMCCGLYSNWYSCEIIWRKKHRKTREYCPLILKSKTWHSVFRLSARLIITRQSK